MKKTLTIIIALCSMYGSNAFAACGTACTKVGTVYTCTDASYDCVNAAVVTADSGDTINITATGTVTWDDRLETTKSLYLIGPGRGNLTIKAGTSVCTGQAFYKEGVLISWTPVTTEYRKSFRISGFTLDSDYSNSACGGIGLYAKGVDARSYGSVPNGVIIDNMTFDNNGPAANPALKPINVWGVIYDNIFNDGYVMYVGGQNTYFIWDGLDELVYGDANNLYFEDNTVNLSGADDPGGVACSQSGRYVARYNTYVQLEDYSLSPWFDVHGNLSGQEGSMGSEIYGNKVTMYANRGIKFFDWRGGKNLGFWNKSIDSGVNTIVVREEYNDSESSSTASQPQHITDTYIWNNRKDGTTLITGANFTVGNTAGVEYEIVENQDLWKYDGSFDGSDGCGCGTLGNRPVTCTIGVGYWATNQDCTQVSNDNAGANPTEYLSGTLYKCTSTDTWTSYFTPYTYPHPLRGESSSCGDGNCDVGECISGCTDDCALEDCCGIEGCNVAIGETVANCPGDCSEDPPPVESGAPGLSSVSYSGVSIN